MTAQEHKGDEPATRRVAMPTAALRPDRRISTAWILPALALCLAIWVVYAVWSQRGVTIVIDFDQGHGLKAGDAVRCRGIAIGQVRKVELSPDLDGVRVTVGLHAQAEHVARAGTQFYVARPRLRLTEVEGLETLIGPRYLAALPALHATEQRRQRVFIGLPDAPAVESIDVDDLEVIVHTERRGSLRAGGAVLYRQVRIGTILSVGLTSDGGGIEARLHVEKPYVQLVRENTRFWDSGGLSTSLSLSGVSFEIESLEAVVHGSISIATPGPPDDGPMVRTGHRFEMASSPDDDWLRWKPLAVIGHTFLPPGASTPRPLRAKIAWTQGTIFRGARLRQGWVLQTSAGLLGPADLLRADAKARDDSTQLEIAGRVVPLDANTTWNAHGLVLLDVQVGASVWPEARRRRPETPEDCLAVADPNAEPLPLAAARLIGDAGIGWRIDPAVSISASWHGASVVARSDGNLVGLLLVEEDVARIALLPAE